MRYFKILIILAIVFVLLYFAFQNVNFSKVISIIVGLNPLYPIVFFMGLFMQFFIRSYRWGILLKPHKNKIPIFTLYNYTVIGFFINTLLPGRIGEPARGILLATEERISRSCGLASVVLERLIDSMVVVLLFMVSLFFLRDIQSPLLTNLRKVSYLAFPIILVIFLLFYLINTNKVFAHIETLIHFFSKIIPVKIRERVILFSLNFVKGLRLNLSIWDFIKLFLSSILVWLFLIPFYWFLMQGFDFGANISMMETVPYFGILVVAAAIPTPAMAGSFDAGSQYALEKVCKVSTNPAAAYTLLVHFLIIMVIVIFGLVALWTKGVNLKTIRDFKEKRKK